MLTDCTSLIFPPSGETRLSLSLEPQILRCSAAGPGGRTLTVLIDTGSDPSAIDLGLARRLGLRLGGFALGQGAASDQVPYTETVLPWLRLGDLTLRDLFAIALDLRSLPFAVDLVLGYNVLRHLVLHIDYSAGSLLLRHPDLGPLAVGTRTLPLVFHEHFPAFTEVQVDQGIMLPLATIDTGSNSGLTVAPDLAQRLGLLEGAAGVAYGQGSGYGGGSPVVRRQGARLQIGHCTLEDVSIDAPAPGAAGDLGRPGRANLGNGALARFRQLSLDYGRAEARVAE